MAVTVNSSNNDHLQRQKNKCLNSTLCVAFEDADQQDGRKLQDEDIHQLAATEGEFCSSRKGQSSGSWDLGSNTHKETNGTLWMCHLINFRQGFCNFFYSVYKNSLQILNICYHVNRISRRAVDTDGKTCFRSQQILENVKNDQFN